jgi:hypothetical protein
MGCGRIGRDSIAARGSNAEPLIDRPLVAIPKRSGDSAAPGDRSIIAWASTGHYAVGDVPTFQYTPSSWSRRQPLNIELKSKGTPMSLC